MPLDAIAGPEGQWPPIRTFPREDAAATEDMAMAQRHGINRLQGAEQMLPTENRSALKVTAHLSSPLAGTVPHLDALLEHEMAQREGKAWKIQRHQEAPSAGEIHIPMLRRSIGGVPVACCSSPIVEPSREMAEHFAKRLATEHAGLLAPKKRLVVAVSNQVFKSYRLPLRLRNARRIVWFALAHRRPVLSLLRSVHSLGKKRSYGYGRVARWEAETIDVDWSWYVLSEKGHVLMRPLPACGELPPNLQGARPDFGACQPPYWHPDRYMEIVVPC